MIRAFDTYADFLSTDSVLVFATQATITSGIYQTVLEQKKVITYTYIFEHLAYAIENSLSRDELLQQIVPAMQYAKEKDVTHIVYGCTHYPLIHTVFVEAAQRVGWDGTYIDPAVYVGKLVASWKLSGERSFCPYASKDTPAFIRESIMFL
jgi:glutamate racemase